MFYTHSISKNNILMSIIYLKPDLDIKKLILTFFKRNKLLKSNLSFFKSGREALVYGLNCYGIDKESYILVPGYICNTIIESLKINQYKILFFDINKDFSININSIKNFLKKYKIKALLAVHYFGYITNIKEIKEICNMNNVLLIEDCCHNFLSQNNEKNIGFNGEITIYSFRKTIPVLIGGALRVKKDKNIRKYSIRNITFSELIFISKKIILFIIKIIGYPNILYLNSKLIFKNSKNILNKKISLIENKIIKPINPSFLSKTYLQDLKYHTETILKIQNNYRILRDNINLKYIQPISDEENLNEVLQFFIINSNDEELIKHLNKNKIEVMRWPGEDLPFEVKDNIEKFPNTNFLNKNIMLLPIHQGLDKEECLRISQILNIYLSLKSNKNIKKV